MIDSWEYGLVGFAAVAAGAVNALAGGGTLLTFPVLTAVGVPPVMANVTNTVALCPGYLGATLAQASDLQGQVGRLRWAVPAGAVGGMAGGIVLLATGERTFELLVPFLILLAAGLLAMQEQVRVWLVRRAATQAHAAPAETWAALSVGCSAVYGGFFGAGLSVIVLAALGMTLDDSLTRLNALKQAVSLSVNVAAAALFLFSGRVHWWAAALMAAGALAGGALGGRVAGKVTPATLRQTVVAIGIVVALIYFARWWPT